MPDEERNVEEEGAEANAQDEIELTEQPVTDAELYAALGLDENLEPVSESPEKPKGKTAAKADEAEEEQEEPASGENAEEAQEEEETSEQEEEQEEQSEEEAPPRDEEEEEESAPKETKGWAKMQKRIAKLTARTHELESQLAHAQKVTLQPTEEDPLADLDSEAEVRERERMMRAVRRWCELNPDGGEIVNSKGESLELSARQVRERKVHAGDVLERVQGRLDYLSARKEFESMARAEYPELFQGKSAEAKICADFLARCPEILRLPNYRLIIGDAIRGMQLRFIKANGKKAAPGTGPKGVPQPGPKVKLAPKAIRSAASQQTRTKAGGMTTSRLGQEFLKTGDKNTLTALIASTL